MKELSYYPGCSLHSTAGEYDHSVRAVFAALGIGLRELHDWNCCCASSAHGLNEDLALALPARNLALAEQTGLDLLVPCAACFNRHKTTQHALRTRPEQRRWMEETVGFTFGDRCEIRPPLAIAAEQLEKEEVRSMISKPLNGLKTVDYYGCLLLRPAEVTEFDNPEHPRLMNHVLNLLGAETRPWGEVSECCGGSLTLTNPRVTKQLVRRLAARAREAGADAVVTSCPLCQLNLESHQNDPSMPVFYFTELIGLAFDLPEAKSWWPKHLINPVPLLKKLRLC